MSEDTVFGLIFYGIGALLVAAGLTLAIGLGGGLAVAGGIVLVLLGLAMVLFWVYATAFGRNMGH